MADEIGVQKLPVLRLIEDIQARVESYRTIGIGAAWDLAVCEPITHDEAVEAHAALEHIGQ